MNKPNIAKRTVRAFERRLAEMRATLSPETYALGHRLLLALKMVPGQERVFAASPVLRNELAKDVASFEAASAAHVASKA